MEELTRDKYLTLLDDVADNLSYGYERWQDEKDYEDINDYSVLFENLVKGGGGKFLKMTKKPFGFKAEIDNITFQYYVNRQVIGVKAS